MCVYLRFQSHLQVVDRHKAKPLSWGGGGKCCIVSKPCPFNEQDDSPLLLLLLLWQWRRRGNELLFATGGRGEQRPQDSGSSARGEDIVGYGRVVVFFFPLASIR